MYFKFEHISDYKLSLSVYIKVSFLVESPRVLFVPRFEMTNSVCVTAIIIKQQLNGYCLDYFILHSF